MTQQPINGTDYVVAAKHPRRDGPLVISTKAGQVIAVSGERCDHVPPYLLASMLANGYLTRVADAGKESE